MSDGGSDPFALPPGPLGRVWAAYEHQWDERPFRTALLICMAVTMVRLIWDIS